MHTHERSHTHRESWRIEKEIDKKFYNNENTNRTKDRNTARIGTTANAVGLRERANNEVFKCLIEHVTHDKVE